MAGYDKDFEFKDSAYRSATLTNGIARSGQRALLYANGMDEEDITPRKILTRETLLNGITGAMATGSSTNLVLHLMAIANEAGVKLELSDFDRISREVPFICNLQPSGKYPIASLDNDGGPIAFVQDGDEITIDIHNRKLEINVSAEEFERRKEGWKPLVKPRLKALAKYATLVTSADTGAIVDESKLIQ